MLHYSTKKSLGRIHSSEGLELAAIGVSTSCTTGGAELLFNQQMLFMISLMETL